MKRYTIKGINDFEEDEEGVWCAYNEAETEIARLRKALEYIRRDIYEPDKIIIHIERAIAIEEKRNEIV